MVLFHANVFKARLCLKHSDFLKATSLDTAPHSQAQQEDAQAEPDARPEGGPVVLGRNPTPSLFTATTLIHAIGAGNYRGCWHQTCPPIESRKRI